MNELSKVYSVTDKLARSRYYMGGLWTFLATGKDTNGAFALIEATFRQGFEPPPHIHEHEYETYYIVEGSMLITVDGEEHFLNTGDYIFLPRGILHSFKLKTPTVKTLLQVAPAGLEGMFMELSRPATSMELPPAPVAPPAVEFMTKVKELQFKYGISGMAHDKINGF